MEVEELLALLEPEVNTLGYELVDLEVRLGGRNGLVRLFIDGEDGITLDDCERVSNQVSALLDVEDPFPGHYVLEVSSPGLDRHLGREKDFAGAVGDEIKLETRRPLDGRRRFRGRLLAFDGVEAQLEVDGRPVSIPFADVAKANAVYEFSSADFGRGR